MQLRAPWRGPTPDEIAVILKVSDATKILTVKDAATGKLVRGDKGEARFQSAPAYGAIFQRDPHGGLRIPGVGGIVANTFYVRSVEKRFASSKLLPDGVAVGGVEVWVRDIPAEFGGAEFSCVDFRRDICTEEVNVLAAWAYKKGWVDQEMIEKADAEEAALRAGKTRALRDPVGEIARALTANQHVPQGPTPEQLAALNLRWDVEQQKLVPIGAK